MMPSETIRTISSGSRSAPGRPGRYHSMIEFTVPESSRAASDGSTPALTSPSATASATSDAIEASNARRRASAHRSVSVLPRTCMTIEVSSLLRELIIEATRIPIEYDYNSRDGRVMALIVDEIRSARTAPLHVPMPHHPQLVRVCHAILKDPAQNDVLDDWAVAAGMCRRTFTRIFRSETGVTFATWRQNVRLVEAMSRLSTGQSVTAVAFDVGYSSPSAFTAMFRRAFGVPPTQYFDAAPPH